MPTRRDASQSIVEDHPPGDIISLYLQITRYRNSEGKQRHGIEWIGLGSLQSEPLRNWSIVWSNTFRIFIGLAVWSTVKSDVVDAAIKVVENRIGIPAFAGMARRLRRYCAYLRLDTGESQGVDVEVIAPNQALP